MVLGHLSKSYRNSWIAIQGDKLNKEYLSLAASSASVEEQANSALKDGRFPDGTTPVKVERRIWRAQVKSQYVEPEFEIDPSSSLDFLYENLGKTVLKNRDPLPPRDDIIVFSEDQHMECFKKMIQWRDCPLEH